ncbi:hypothetical protein ACZ90_08840 [Streptomyces albus subsp. albus]|nr:hypothetical protein ACZ90_08840 [Streptomyces albus subsp. albus]
MTLQRSAPTAGVAHGAMPAQPGAPVRELLTEGAPVVRDLRGRAGRAPYSLDLTAGDVVVVSRGRTLHLVLLDVTPEVARQGQRERGRGVSGYAFARHRHAVARLLRDTEQGLLPAGCTSAVLLDREAAGALGRISFTADGAPPAR